MDANTLGLMAAGFLHVFSPMNMGMMILGVTIGIVVGCMPGRRRLWVWRCCCP